MKQQIEFCINNSDDRFDFWSNFVRLSRFKNVAEIGTYQGYFAMMLLNECPDIVNYTIVDPWKELEDWNKPGNQEDFDKIYLKAMKNIGANKHKTTIIRKTTYEASDMIANNYYDWVYIDADHTLKGITIDLINMWPKIKNNGFIAGDDLIKNIWHHGKEYEPSMVYPFAIYFAMAMKTEFYALPYNQYLISKKCHGFELINYTGRDFRDLSLLNQLSQYE